ncbi:MAG: hypothetical protein C0594_11540, partial [Marinilabiliales bacterium]
TGLCAGDYDVTVSDNKGCTITDTYTLTEPTALTLTNVNIDVSCNGLSDGEIDITAGGGTPGYTYSWSSSTTCSVIAAQEDQTGLCAGNYNVTVEDAKGCTISNTYTIGQPLPITIPATISPVSCNGGSDGEIDITASGGTPGYTYSWSSSTTCSVVPSQEDQTGLCAGSYTVTVEDINSCISITTFTVTEPTILLVSESITDVTCNGLSNGQIDITVSGGTPGYTYSWSSNTTCSVVAGQEDQTGLCAGDYDVTVEDAIGCQFTATYTVSEPLPIGITNSSTDALCYLGNDGEIDITLTNGNFPFNYNWNTADGCGLINGLQDQTGLCAGTYCLTVTDASLCTETVCVTINEPNDINITGTVTQTTCPSDADGGVDITVNGGTTPYDYEWTGGSTDEDLTNATVGSWTVTVTDDHSCSKTQSFNITPQATPAVTGVVTDVACYGENTGVVNITASGGSNYSYNWSSSTTCSVIAAQEDQTGLCAGDYDVTVTDVPTGCTISDLYTVTEPAQPLGISGVVSDVLCFGDATGEIDITVTGGTANYSYSWENSNSANISVAEDVAGLTAGAYYVTVTDNNSCTIEDTYTVAQPDSLSSEICSVVHSYCNNLPTVVAGVTFLPDGTGVEYTDTISHSDFPSGLTITSADQFRSICANMEHSYLGDLEMWIECPNGQTTTFKQYPGGGPTFLGEPIDVFGDVNPGIGYDYCWSVNNPSPTYSTMVAESMNYSTLPAGSYASYQNFNSMVGCPLNGDWVMHVVDHMGIDNGYIFNWTLNFDPSVFPDGFCTGIADVCVTGGTTSYSYEWSIGGTDAQITDLCTGDYDVTVTDNNGCTSVSNVTIVDTITYEAGITDSSLITCSGDCNATVTLTPIGGTTPYTYLWTSGATDSTATGLCEGWAAVTVTDATGCERTDSTLVINPQILSLSFTNTHIDCYGNTNGAIDMSISGGYLPYNISWSTITGSGLDPLAEDQSGLSPGWYYVTVTDDEGCSVNDSVQIVEPSAALSVNLDLLTNVDCNGASTGAIDITTSGGTLPYSYTWATSNGSGLNVNQEDQSGLTAGDYDLTITDGNSCVVFDSYTISEPAPMGITFMIVDANCGMSDGTVCATVTTTEGNPVSYDWGSSGTGQCLNAISTGVYDLTVTTDIGCTGTSTAIVGNASAPSIDSLVATDVLCYGNTTGSIISYVSIDVDDTITYNWSGPSAFTSNDTNLVNIGAGEYWLTVTDQVGCVDIASIVVDESNQLIIDTTIVHNLCHGDVNGSIDLNISGGNSPYNINWVGPGTFTSIFEDISGLASGDYYLTVSDVSG